VEIESKEKRVIQLKLHVMKIKVQMQVEIVLQHSANASGEK